MRCSNNCGVLLGIVVGLVSCAGDSSSGPGTDIVPPVVSGAVNGWDSQTPYGSSGVSFEAGDTIHFTVSIRDNVGTRLLGLDIGGARDSLELPDSLVAVPAVLEVAYPVPPGPRGNLSIRAFAVDVAGNRTEVELANSPAWIFGRTTMVQRHGDFPGVSVSYAFDRGRNRLYYSDDSTPGIGVYNLATMTDGAPIAVPYPVGDLDLTVDGADLLVSLPMRHSIALLPLDSTGILHETSVIGATTDSLEPRFLRATAGGHALISFFDPLNPARAGKLVTYDFTTGTGTFVADVGVPYPSADQVRILASTSRRELVAFSSVSGGARLFEAATGSIGGLVSSIAGGTWNASIDSSGNNFLFGNTWFGTNLVHRADFDSPHSAGHEAISPGGTIGYFGTLDGFLRIDLASGHVIDHVYIGFVPIDIVPIPGSSRLFLFQRQLSAVEVTLTPPPSAPAFTPGSNTGGGIRDLLRQALGRSRLASVPLSGTTR